MTVTRADLLTRLTNPAKASAETQNTVLLTSAACADMLEAKAEIERLQVEVVKWKREGGKYTAGCELCAPREAENERLRVALKPFAEAAKSFVSWDGPGTEMFPLSLEHAEGGQEFHCTIGDLRRAGAVLAGEQNGGKS